MRSGTSNLMGGAMHNLRRIGLFAVGLLLAAGVAGRVARVLAHGDGNVCHELHWIVYGYDRVWYRQRTYVDPTSMAFSRAEAYYGPLVATRATVIGLPVLLPNGLAPSSEVPTVLILRSNSGSVLVYALSGGP
jgi:hypothetical protein